MFTFGITTVVSGHHTPVYTAQDDIQGLRDGRDERQEGLLERGHKCGMSGPDRGAHRCSWDGVLMLAGVVTSPYHTVTASWGLIMKCA